MRSVLWLLIVGLGLVVIAGVVGGSTAVVGGSVALLAQTWAVLLLRPVMGAPNPQFMARWLGGMAIRFIALASLVVWSVTHRAILPPLPATLGYLGVLLPLLFLETRFLK